MQRLGVLALGDSITVGGPERPLASWAACVARGLALPLTNEAEDGAGVEDVLASQLEADGRYDLGCLYVGTNDVRTPDWDRRRFETAYRRAVDFLGEHCERTLCVTLPLDLGRPRAGATVEHANRTIERVAASAGALTLDLRRFRGRKLLMPDHVHPTARGQLAIAERALALLAADGLPARAPLARFARDDATWRSRLRDDAAYAYSHLKVSIRAAMLVAISRLRSGSMA